MAIRKNLENLSRAILHVVMASWGFVAVTGEENMFADCGGFSSEFVAFLQTQIRSNSLGPNVRQIRFQGYPYILLFLFKFFLEKLFGGCVPG